MDIWGTNRDDILQCGSGNVLLGLGGNDTLLTVPGTGLYDQVLLGGIGNDTYIASPSASAIVLDAGGAYDTLFTSINLYGNSSAYLIANRHLWMGDYSTGCIVVIPDAPTCGLETISFAGGETYAFSDFYWQLKQGAPNYSPYANNYMWYLYELFNAYSAAKMYPQNVGQELPPEPAIPEPVMPAPNPVEVAKTAHFNEEQYMNNKLAALHAEGQMYTMEGLAQALSTTGLTPWDHFRIYGFRETGADGTTGIDPNWNFDVSAYFAQKVEQCRSNGEYLELAEVVQAFADAGLDPISHYALYGQAEGLVPVQVSGAAAAAESVAA